MCTFLRFSLSFSVMFSLAFPPAVVLASSMGESALPCLRGDGVLVEAAGGRECRIAGERLCATFGLGELRGSIGECALPGPMSLCRPALRLVVCLGEAFSSRDPLSLRSDAGDMLSGTAGSGVAVGLVKWDSWA